MRVCAVIMECNPFHAGHAYILKKARQITGADAVIVFLSGDYVQRGTPAILPREERIPILLQNGADLCLSLPFYYSVGAADYFARGAVCCAMAAGIVTDLVFGSESGDPDFLQDAARLLLDEPEDYRALLKQYLAKGLSYPAARDTAAAECTRSVTLPSCSNDILGTEYLKSLQYYGADSITAHAVKTIDVPGASVLRQRLLHPEKFILPPGKSSAPESGRRDLSAGDASVLRDIPVPEGPYLCEDDFSRELWYALLFAGVAGGAAGGPDSGPAADVNADPEPDYTIFQDVPEDLSNRLRGLARHGAGPLTFRQTVQQLKTRNHTETAVQRALLHILLGIRKSDVQAVDAAGPCGYLRVLGMRRGAEQVLSALADQASVPVITRLSRDLPALSPVYRGMLLAEIRANALYDRVRGVTPLVPGFSKPLIVVH